MYGSLEVNFQYLISWINHSFGIYKKLIVFQETSDMLHETFPQGNEWTTWAKKDFLTLFCLV